MSLVEGDKSKIRQWDALEGEDRLAILQPSSSSSEPLLCTDQSLSSGMFFGCVVILDFCHLFSNFKSAANGDL